MARILGEAGRYVVQQAAQREKQIAVSLLSGFGVSAWVSRVLFGSLFHRPIGWILGLSLLALVLVLKWWILKNANILEKEKKDLKRGAGGEMSVGLCLEKLPEAYFIIHDIKGEYGNLDHVVIGPTGVFAIETKNWRGTISADGKGELRIDGRNLDKPYVRRFVARAMRIKERIDALSPGTDYFINTLFVFTSARVDAPWGKTGAVHCVREDQLCRYIEGRKGNRLNPEQVETIAQAFRALARMETSFEDVLPGTVEAAA